VQQIMFLLAGGTSSRSLARPRNTKCHGEDLRGQAFLRCPMLFFFRPGLRIRHDLRASRRPSLLMLASTSPLALVPTATGAIVTRHDVPASAYIAKPADLPSYCRMLAPDGGGALISRYWVLTAAHLAPVIKPGQRIVCGAESLIVASIVVHPKYQETVGRHDLALVRLAQAAKQVPLTLARQSPTPGVVVNLIGHWQSGTGLTGTRDVPQRKLKGATNRLSAIDENWQQYVFDHPGSADVTPLEGVSGGGDSGSPAYIFREGKAEIVGVGSRNRDTNEDGIEQNYGDTDLFVNVPEYLPWIDRVMAGRDTSLSRWLMRHEFSIGLAGVLASFLIIGAAFLRLRRVGRLT